MNERDGELTAETTKPLSYTTAPGIQMVIGYDEFEKEIKKVEKDLNIEASIKNPGARLKLTETSI